LFRNCWRRKSQGIPRDSCADRKDGRRESVRGSRTDTRRTAETGDRSE
jgi:hypothetical protein